MPVKFRHKHTVKFYRLFYRLSTTHSHLTICAPIMWNPTFDHIENAYKIGTKNISWEPSKSAHSMPFKKKLSIKTTKQWNNKSILILGKRCKLVICYTQICSTRPKRSSSAKIETKSVFWFPNRCYWKSLSESMLIKSITRKSLSYYLSINHPPTHF